MPTLRNSLIVAGMALAMLVPVSTTFARGGGRGGGGGGRGGGGRGGAGGNMQQAPRVNQTLVADQQSITTANTAVTKAKSDLDAAVSKSTTEFHKGADYAAAQKAVDDAAKEVAKARATVLATLKKNPDYKSASDKEAASDAKTKKLRADGADRDAISAQSNETLKLGKITSDMEREALSADKPYQDALAKLKEASDALKALDTSFAETLKTDTTVSGLQQTYDTAKTTLTDAQKKYQQDLASNTGG